MKDRDESAVQKLAKALIQFRYLYRYHKRACSEQPNPMRPSDVMMLFAIKEQQCRHGGSVTATALSERLKIKTPSVNVVLSSLEKGGMIMRTTDPDDRRFVRIELSQSGEACVERCQREYITRIRELTAYLGAEKSSRLAELMDEVYSYLRQKEQGKSGNTKE